MLIIIYNIIIYYYAVFCTPKCLMTLMTHDTHDHIPVTLPENNANTGSEYIIHSQQTNDSLKS